ncbi:MAG: DUF2189 domain-containing protein [Paracoccaceae bacterium]
MPKTIGNPLSWTAAMFSAPFAAGAARAEHDAAPPRTRALTTADLREALRMGWDDLMHFRSDVVFACLLYPVIGGLLVAMALQGNLVQLLFPTIAGFALAGPVAAIGLYEMSRQREAGATVGWTALFDVMRSPRFGGIVTLALFHGVIFLVWIMVANMIFKLTMGAETNASMTGFFTEVLTTSAGWTMAIIGTAVGFCFAVAVLAISVVSFPMMLDRDVSLPVAVTTSVRVARENPVVIATWGAIVAACLAIGALPALLGLVLALPLLGHATWHLYRRAVI